MIQIGPNIFEQIHVQDAIVLRYIAENFKQREIADLLGLQPSTVKSRVQKLERLLECADMDELARRWRQMGPDWLTWVISVTGINPPGAKQESA